MCYSYIKILVKYFQKFRRYHLGILNWNTAYINFFLWDKDAPRTESECCDIKNLVAVIFWQVCIVLYLLLKWTSDTGTYSESSDMQLFSMFHEKNRVLLVSKWTLKKSISGAWFKHKTNSMSCWRKKNI